MSDAAAAGAPVPGFFGKVRTHGDFVARRLPMAFVTPWDACLQDGMRYARQHFGEHWLAIYLNAPVWCFALAAHVCGPGAWAGVLMPGVDRVGRHFPFTIAAPLEADALVPWLRGAQPWFDDATRAVLSTLDADFVLDRFEACLDVLAPQTGAPAAPWRYAPADAAASGAFEEVLAASLVPGWGAWWSAGSEAVPSALLAGPDLPDPPCFAALLDPGGGTWPASVPLRRAG